MWDCNFIFVNLTNLCNIRCKKCITPLLINRHGELPKDLLLTIIELFKSNGFRGTIRCGLGENLIYTHLEEIFKYLSLNSCKFKIDLLTNGLAFNVDKDIYFKNINIRWGVTLDGMFNEDIKGLQIGLDLETVKNNLYKIRHKYPESNFYLNYTLHKNNIHHLLDFVLMAMSLKIKTLFVTPLKVFKNKNTEYLLKYKPDLSSPDIVALFSQIKDIANKNKFNIRLPECSNSFIQCSYTGYYSPIIDIDGEVSFCSGREHVKIGKVTDPKVSKIWIKLRKKIEMKGGKSEFCSKCLSIKNENKVILEMA